MAPGEARPCPASIEADRIGEIEAWLRVGVGSLLFDQLRDGLHVALTELAQRAYKRGVSDAEHERATQQHAEIQRRDARVVDATLRAPADATPRERLLAVALARHDEDPWGFLLQLRAKTFDLPGAMPDLVARPRDRVSVPTWLLPGLDASPAARDGFVDVCTPDGWNAVVGAMARHLWPDDDPSPAMFLWNGTAWALHRGAKARVFLVKCLPEAALQHAAIQCRAFSPTEVIGWLERRGWATIRTGDVTRWRTMRNEGSLEVTIPMMHAAPDYYRHERVLIDDLAMALGCEPFGLRLEMVREVTERAAKPEQTPAVPTRTCNRHDDCDAADAAGRERGGNPPDHCHDDGCEDCHGQ